MMLEGASLLLDELVFPECPRWHEGKLWFSDMDGKKVMTVDLEGKVQTIVDVPGQPAGLGWLPDGRLLVVSMTDRRLLRLDPQGLVEVANLWDLASWHCNDMVVDQAGRAYIGNFGFEYTDPSAMVRLAEIILVEPDGGARLVADQMVFPNGTVITPDRQTLIVAESGAARLIAFTILADGSLSQRRIWAQFDDLGLAESLENRVVPDGICLDQEGAVWVASCGDHPAVLRVLEGGEVTHRIAGTTTPYACMLGGADGCTLFIVGTARAGEDQSLEPVGRIETIRVDVPGAGLP
jgi:sugar lactone lactonase YvrE